MAKVSVLVPVYNVEKYLSRCLDSIINQTFQDIEIICINDGSTDDSAKILEAYQKLDSRIKVYHKENGGLSSVRNMGVELAQGEYTIFVDSDDYISSVLVEKVYNNAIANDSDIVIFDYIWGTHNFNDRRILTISDFGKNFENNPFNIESIEPDMYKLIPVMTWCKMYKTSLIKDVLFWEDMVFEDVPYWAAVYSKAKKVTYLNEPLYFYLVGRSDQITYKRSEETFDTIKSYQRAEQSLKDSGHWERCKYSVQLLMMMDFLAKLNVIRDDLREKLYNAFKALDNDIDFDYYFKENYSEFERRSVKLYKLLTEVEYSEFQKLRAKV